MDYKMPSLVTTKPEVIPIQKSFAISTALHPAVVFLIWLIITILALMGINLSLFHKPKAQLKKDIEFVLVDKEAMPRDKNTRNRADMNSRSGGINDPKRPVSMPSPAPKKLLHAAGKFDGPEMRTDQRPSKEAGIPIRPKILERR